MRSSRFSSALLLSAALLALATGMYAQTGSGGSILGTVTDPSGAAIPNVGITITDLDTNTVRHLSTNESGQYISPDLPVGHYRVRAEATGFKSSEQDNVTVNVGDRDRVDFPMQIGSAQESVTVQAEAVQVQSDSSEVSDVITGQQVTQLSTNGRSIYSLTALIPGASGNQADFMAPTAVSGDNNVSFNGTRKSATLFMVDGGEDLDRGGSGNISILPSIDAVGEFRALTSNYSADYGLSAGAVFTMVFKSGTKDLHASAWEFVRNDAFQAGSYFRNANRQQAPELRSNTYGFNVGGPVFIPGLYNKDKDKTFFFYNMEWRKLIQGQTLNTVVPPTSEYGGVFPAVQIPAGVNPCTVKGVICAPTLSQLSSAQAQKLIAAGVTPGKQFPNNTIPASLLDSNAQILLQAGLFPAPNSGANFIGGSNPKTDVREEIVRIDHHFNDKFWVFGHYVAEQVSQGYGTSTWSGENVPTVSDIFQNPAYSGVVHATYSVSPNLFSETAFNYNGNRITITPGGLYARPSGFNVPELFAGNALNRIPQINLTGSTGTNYDASSFPWHNKADDYQFREDLSWSKGAHQFKFGFSYALYKKIQDLFGQTQGSFTFNGGYTGNDFADFLLGYANSYQELAVQDKGLWDNNSFAAYFQDNWRVNSRLTLNLGLRWDGIPHTFEENNRGSNFYPNLYNPANAAVLLPGGNAIDAANTPAAALGTSPNPLLNGYQFYLNGIGIEGKNGIPVGLVDNHWANFGPRVGFAYDVTGGGKTVIRGGFGITYERVEGNDRYNGGPNVPFSSQVGFQNVLFSNPNTSISSGQTLVAPISVANITGVAGSDYKNPRTYQYSLGVQRQVTKGTVASASYVGNVGRHLNDYRNINLPATSALPCLSTNSGGCAYNTSVPYSGFNYIRLSENAENSHYNSLQTEIKSQLKDVTLDASYTFSKSVDPVFGNNNGDLANVSNPYDRSYDYGPSNFDRTHVFVADFVYNLPFFRNATNGFVKRAVGGWQLSGVITAETGLPLNITLGGSQGNNGIPQSQNRPDMGTVSQPHQIYDWISLNSFAEPAAGAWGSLKKGAFRGPGRQNWNLSLFKEFVISEARGTRFELRIESFNTFNHTQFNAVASTWTPTSSNFGQVTSTYDPRTFQFGAKFYF